MGNSPCAILFVGPCHVLSYCLIGQLYYHVTFEWHSGHGLERCNAFYAIIIANTFLQAFSKCNSDFDFFMFQNIYMSVTFM